MKKLIFLLLLLTSNELKALEPKKTAAVLTIRAYGLDVPEASLQLMVQHEMEKSGKFNMLEPEEVRSLLIHSAVNPDSCFGKNCVMQAGSILNASILVTGRYDVLGDKIAVTFKLYDRESDNVETTSLEFLNQPSVLEKITSVAVADLTGGKRNQEIKDLLLYYDQPVSNPNIQTDLSGPRFGAYMTTGDIGKFLRMSEEVGGFEMGYVSTTFGWQSEKQYLSSGRYRALIEAMVLVSGLESGRFIPSFSLLNGVRLMPSGWELAFGPTFRIINMKDGMINSNGTPGISTGFVIAGGKTFRSGFLNLPVNLYTIPRKHGWVIGTSVGFNVNKQKPDKKD